MDGKRHFIKEWREHKNLTQNQVADRVEKEQATVSRIENGKVPYTQETLEAFAHAFGCEPFDLLRPPPTNQPESEFEAFARNLDARQKAQAVRVLRALFDKDADAA